MKKLIAYFTLVKLFNKAPMQLAWFRIVEGIMKFVNDTAEADGPRMTNIALIDMTEGKIFGDRNMVSLWACTGEMNPIDRIGQLNQKLALQSQLLAAKDEYIKLHKLPDREYYKNAEKERELQAKITSLENQLKQLK